MDNLTNPTLLDDMTADYQSFCKKTDPYNVMSGWWLWARWIRSN